MNEPVSSSARGPIRRAACKCQRLESPPLRPPARRRRRPQPWQPQPLEQQSSGGVSPSGRARKCFPGCSPAHPAFPRSCPAGFSGAAPALRARLFQERAPGRDQSGACHPRDPSCPSRASRATLASCGPRWVRHGLHTAPRLRCSSAGPRQDPGAHARLWGLRSPNPQPA